MFAAPRYQGHGYARCPACRGSEGRGLVPAPLVLAVPSLQRGKRFTNLGPGCQLYSIYRAITYPGEDAPPRNGYNMLKRMARGRQGDATMEQGSGDLNTLAHLLAVARGAQPADLVLRGGQVFSVFTGEFLPGDVAIVGGTIAGLGRYEGHVVEDVAGAYIVPGFIDGHCHIESTMLTPAEFARTVVPLGTTTVVTDPHETANVLGVAGIRYMLDASEDVPLTVYVMVPSCVPASSYESPFMALEAPDLAPLMGHQRVLGIAELMNYPAVLGGDPAMLAKIALGAGMALDGHAPEVSGHALNAYLAAGVDSDHECTTLDEALEKRRLGMWIMIRQGSTTRNLEALLPLVTRYGPERCLFVTDDRTAASLLGEGHINAMVRAAVELGLPAHQAITLATWNAAQRFGLRGLGAVAPGYHADLLVLDDLRDFRPRQVYHWGQLVARDGRALATPRRPAPSATMSTVHLAPLTPAAFIIPAHASGPAEMRVIRAIEGQALTGEERRLPPLRDGQVVADPAQDLIKVAVVERHHATGRVATALVSGFGLRRGAFASSVGHDAHNITVAGVSDADMALAVTRLAEIGGGLVVVDQGAVRGELALPIAGLMCEQPAAEVAAALATLDALLAQQGVAITAPFMTLSFLPLSVIPALKLTDRGLVDVTTFRPTSPWVAAEG